MRHVKMRTKKLEKSVEDVIVVNECKLRTKDENLVPPNWSHPLNTLERTSFYEKLYLSLDGLFGKRWSLHEFICSPFILVEVEIK